MRIPRNSAYELVGTLADRQYLRLDDTGRVTLGARLFELGSRFAQSIDLVREARETAAHLRDACGETVHVAMLDGRFVIYLVKEESRQMVRMMSAIGTRLPAHVSGVGKAMLAGLPEAELRRRLGAAPLERMTPNSITSIADLLVDLDRTRSRGYAIDNEESSPEVGCVAAAVRDATGEFVAAISISGPVTRVGGERRPELAARVMEAADGLSRRLGYLADGDVRIAGRR